MDLTQPDDLRLALRLAGIAPKKGLGQHFLIDRPALELIVAAAGLTHADTVLEVGPGLGVMTGLLVQTAGKVVAVEADKVLAELLLREAPGNLEVVNDDIILYDLTRLPRGYKVVANIPYYLTSKLLRQLLESPNPPSTMVLLIQREVAERVTAKPGKMSILALSVQYYAEPEIIGQVERHKFWPQPDVDSAILLIKRRPQPAFEADAKQLFRLIKAGFGERRKQLKNSLAGGLNTSDELSVRLLKQANIPVAARAQELTLKQWEALYQQAAKANLFN